MYKAKIKDKILNVNFENSDANIGTISDNKFELNIEKKNDRFYHIIKNYKSYNIDILSINNYDKTIKLKVNNNIYIIEINDKIDELLKKMGIKNQ